MADETATVTLTRNGAVVQSAVVVLQGPAGGALPPGFQLAALPQGTLIPVVGATNPTVQAGHSYQGCTFTGPYFYNTSDVEFVNCTCSGPYGVKGDSHRIHFKGCTLGHSRDTDCQITPYNVAGATRVPSDITFEACKIDDVQRTTTGVHIEGTQIGGVQRIAFLGCVYGSIAPNSVFDIFANSWIGVGGLTQAPITDLLIDGGTFAATSNLVDSGSGSYAISLADTQSQIQRVCIRNTRCGQSINLQGSLDPAARADVLVYGNARLDGTPLVKRVAGGFVNYS